MKDIHQPEGIFGNSVVFRLVLEEDREECVIGAYLTHYLTQNRQVQKRLVNTTLTNLLNLVAPPRLELGTNRL